MTGRPHQKPSPTKSGDEHRSERGAEAEERVEHEHRGVDVVRMERGGQRVDRRDGQPESDAEARGREEQDRVRDRFVAREQACS